MQLGATPGFGSAAFRPIRYRSADARGPLPGVWFTTSRSAVSRNQFPMMKSYIGYRISISDRQAVSTDERVEEESTTTAAPSGTGRTHRPLTVSASPTCGVGDAWMILFVARSAITRMGYSYRITIRRSERTHSGSGC